MSPPRVKICGLTDPQEAAACARLGAWAVGVVLASGSPRSVSPEEARRVLADLPAGVARVGVVVELDPAAAPGIVREVGLTHLQVHGPEAAAVRENAGVPVIEAFRVGGESDLQAARESAADLVLLDARVPGMHGGTGRSFDWSLLEARPLDRPFVLAGGLLPGNVAEAVRRTRPTHVDVSSGVEAAPGTKDLAAVEAFIRAAAGRVAA